METRVCGRCSEEKPLETSYSWSNKAEGLRQVYCKECCNALAKINYDSNKQRYKDNAAKWRQINRGRHWGKYLEAKSGPCADCGITYHPYAMDFDHRNSEDKVLELSSLIRRRFAWESIKAEIDKCDLVCATCHRMRTFNRMTEDQKASYDNRL